jgi:hypothetical protein
LLEAADAFIGRKQALEVGLAAETASLNDHSTPHGPTGNPKIRVVARAFAEDEAKHVAELTKWITAPGGRPPAGD